MQSPYRSQSEDARIRAGVAAWFYNQPMMTVLGLQAVTALIMTGYFWNTQSHGLLLGWLGYTLFCSLLFGVTTLHYRRLLVKAPEQVQLNLRLPLEGVAIGLGWGLPILWPGVLDDASSMLFITIISMGVVAASVGVLAPHPRSFHALVILVILPFVVVLFLDGGRLHVSLAVLLAIYLVSVLISGHNMKRAVFGSIRLRFENIGLVDELTEKNIKAEQSRLEAEQASLAKSKFLAAASHDLRQPLHALGLFVDVLDSRIRFPEVRNIVNNIKASTDALADLFDALLDISKLDAGVLEPKVGDVALQALLHRLQSDYRAQAENKGIALRVTHCPHAVHSDPMMLERILRNLTSNAIRYTRSGGVLLCCRRLGEQLQIGIYDTGIGIPEDQIDKVFEEFYQVQNPERDRRKGLGLGLAIVRRLCQLLGHRLEVRSVPGRGTVFRVSVPIAVSMAIGNAVEPTYTADVGGACVLIIDDEATIRHGMRDLLQQWGCRTIDAESAPSALEALSAQRAEPDIIFSDYRLRDNRTGIQAIALVRRATRKTTPAVLITGDTAPECLREAKVNGIPLLHKPVSPARLRSLMSYLLESSETISKKPD